MPRASPVPAPLPEEDGGVTGFLADCANAFADVPIINSATNMVLIEMPSLLRLHLIVEPQKG
jgi:hypothetical protein